MPIYEFLCEKCKNQFTLHLGLTEYEEKNYKCPKCGYDVEIFSDEISRKCYKCGERVYREKVPSCLDWCASARDCVGEERWKELVKEGIVTERK